MSALDASIWRARAVRPELPKLPDPKIGKLEANIAALEIKFRETTERLEDRIRMLEMALLKDPPVDGGARLRPTVKDIISVVSAHYDIPIDDMISHRRTTEVMIPRQVTMYLCRHLTLHSTSVISRMLGNRDHTTVIHGIRKIDSLRIVDAEMAQNISAIEQKIKLKQLVT